MVKIVKETIHAKGIDIGIYTTNFENEFISLTDIAKYRSESPEKPITVSVIAHSEPEGMWTEKNVGDVVSYVKNDIEHYIMNNNDLLVSTWYIGNLECSIYGGLSESDMKTMIDSIYEE